MSRRRTLTAAQKRSALVQIDRISAALKALAMETLNRHAKISDTDHALRLAGSVERLRDRIWKYPAERRKAEQEANRKRAAAADARRAEDGKLSAKPVQPQFEATQVKPQKRDHATESQRKASTAVAQQVDAIADILKSAADMSADLRNDPASLLHLGAQALCDPDATRHDLHQALFAALTFIGARHHQRITNQLREATKAMRARMN